MSRGDTACVIGAGVGALVGSELARQGFSVKVLDEQPRPLAGASGRHGRRLHLGEHYSGDPFRQEGLNTGQRCTLGALSLLQRWPEVARPPGRWWQFITTDSMTSPDEYEEFLAGLRAFHRELVEEGIDATLLFGRPEERHRALEPEDYARLVNVDGVALAIESREAVIDAAALNAAFRGELAAAGEVEVLTRHRVRSIAVTPSGYCLSVTTPDGEREFAADYVVNAAWHGLGRLTESLGVERQESSARLRMMAEVRLPRELAEAPSMYFHRGVLGNHTNVGNGRALVLAETVCNLAFAPAHECPEAWVDLVRANLADDEWAEPLAAIAGAADSTAEMEEEAISLLAHLRTITAEKGNEAARSEALRAAIAERILSEYRRLVPTIAGAETTRLIPNVVVSPGDAVLSDPRSAVHRRDAVVREPCAGYFEVLTGKLTYAVLVAQETTARLLARARDVHIDTTRDLVMSSTVRRAWT